MKLEYTDSFGGSPRKEWIDEAVGILGRADRHAIRQAESGTPVGDLCRQLVVSDATFYTWRNKYAHLGVSELRRLRQVEEEHSPLKRVVVDLSLDKHMLSEALRKKV